MKQGKEGIYPANFVDPFGLQTLSETVISVGIIGAGGAAIAEYYRKKGLNKGAKFPPLRPGWWNPRTTPESYGKDPTNPSHFPFPKFPWWVYPFLGGGEVYKYYCNYHPETDVCREYNPDNSPPKGEGDGNPGETCPIPKSKNSNNGNNFNNEWPNPFTGSWPKASPFIDRA